MCFKHKGLAFSPIVGLLVQWSKGKPAFRLTYPKREPGSKAPKSTVPVATLKVRSIEAAFRKPISDLKSIGDDEGATLLDEMMRAKAKGDDAAFADLSAQFHAHQEQRAARIFGGGNP